MSDISQKLSYLRKLMCEHHCDFYLVPSTDAHNSEYTPENRQRRAYISHFDGSNGEALIGKEQAYLWTDSRYFLQAEKQLDTNCFILQKQKGSIEAFENWLKRHAKGKTLGIDPTTVSISRAERLMTVMNEIGGNCQFSDDNLIDQTWGKFGKIPKGKAAPLFLHPEKYSGEACADKMARIRRLMKAEDVETLIISVLDEIAWLLNIRGKDIPFNPLVISYVILTRNSCTFFVDPKKLTSETNRYLDNNHITVEPYDHFKAMLPTCQGRTWIDDKTANYAIAQCLSKKAVYYQQSPIALVKACKNSTEIHGAQIAHQKDAVAMIKFMHWLYHNWQEGIDEIQAQTKLEHFRQQQQNYIGPSFETISGFAGNGAIIHYRATYETSKIINDRALYLLDSGGQYLEGTTDITRTFHLGTPLEVEKRYYTLVLKGHLALQNVHFPEGTKGEQLDALARSPLWQYGADYGHGTGHGVGSFLCVHEGPQRISPRPSAQALLPGMILSNEPGVYFAEKFGIRIENLCFVKPLTQKQHGNFDSFYHFEDLTLVPYARNLIDIQLLTNEEIKQINAYHRRVSQKIGAMLDNCEIKAWLDEQTAAL